jgi:hypothetical protein
MDNSQNQNPNTIEEIPNPIQEAPKQAEVNIEMNKDDIDLSLIQNQGSNDDEILNPPEEKESVEEKVHYSLETQLVRRRLIIKIQRYKATFPEFLQNFDEDDLEYKSESQLGNLLQEVKFTVSCRNTTTNLEGIAAFGVRTVESIGCKYTPLKLDGYSRALLNNESFVLTLKEFALENDDLIYTTPAKRLAYISITTALAVHYANDQNDKSVNSSETAQQMNQDLTDAMQNDYNDL